MIRQKNTRPVNRANETVGENGAQAACTRHGCMFIGLEL